MVPAGLAGCYLAIFLGGLLFAGMDQFCPDRYVVSGHCMGSVAAALGSGIEIAMTSLAAVLVVSFATLTAPRYDAVVAWAAYAVGAVTLTTMVYGSTPGLPYFGAIISGLITAVFLSRSRKRRDDD